MESIFPQTLGLVRTAQKTAKNALTESPIAVPLAKVTFFFTTGFAIHFAQKTHFQMEKIPAKAAENL